MKAFVYFALHVLSFAVAYKLFKIIREEEITIVTGVGCFLASTLAIFFSTRFNKEYHRKVSKKWLKEFREEYDAKTSQS